MSVFAVPSGGVWSTPVGGFHDWGSHHEGMIGRVGEFHVEWGYDCVRVYQWTTESPTVVSRTRPYPPHNSSNVEGGAGLARLALLLVT